MEEDRTLPLSGRGVPFVSVAAVSRFWRRANGCRAVSRGETAAWRVERGRRCDAPYASYVVKGAGHGWPAVATELAIRP
jgi:poly(3-hydroxybutyrate) depolymerase